MKIEKIVSNLTKNFKLEQQIDGDESGLQTSVGLNQDLTKTIICLDVTNNVIDECLKNNANFIVSHHPIFKNNQEVPLLDCYETILNRLKSNCIPTLSLHTCFDFDDNGLNFYIASLLELKNVSWFNNNKQTLFITGKFETELSLQEIAKKFKNIGSNNVFSNIEDSNKKFKNIAFCCGSGFCSFKNYLKELANAGYLLITGDIKYHDWVLLDEYNLFAIDVGHEIENQFVNYFNEWFKKEYPTEQVICLSTKFKKKIIL